MYEKMMIDEVLEVESDLGKLIQQLLDLNIEHEVVKEANKLHRRIYAALYKRVFDDVSNEWDGDDGYRRRVMEVLTDLPSFVEKDGEIEQWKPKGDE